MDAKAVLRLVHNPMKPMPYRPLVFLYINIYNTGTICPSCTFCKNQNVFLRIKPMTVVLVMLQTDKKNTFIKVR